MVARAVVAPLGPLGDEARAVRGRMLSLGSGISLVERYLAELNPDLTVDGIDLDPRRVELIRSTASRSPRVTLRLGDATALDEPEAYDAVLVCDAIHHFDPDAHKVLADSIARCLRPGGVVLVKDLDTRPRWKHEWNRLHDRLVAPTRSTAGRRTRWPTCSPAPGSSPSGSSGPIAGSPRTPTTSCPARKP